MIGVAKDGVPVYAPPAAGDAGFAREQAESDACGEHLADAGESSFCVIICTRVLVYCAIIRTFVHAGGLALSVTERCEGGGSGGCLLDTMEHGQYHYRSLPTCLDSPDNDEADGHSGVIAVMLGTQITRFPWATQYKY